VLDALRLIAATMVVFYHYVGLAKAKIALQGTAEALPWGTPATNVFPRALHDAAGFGWTGVELFFLISGFVICMSGWGRRPADFFVSRVARLVPGYWAAIAVTAAVLAAFPRLTAGIRPSMVLTNLAMVQNAYGVPNLNPAFWTLYVELIFYLLFGIVAIRGASYRRMVTFCVLWSVGSIIAAHSGDSALRTVLIPSYSPYFIAGIAFYLIYRFRGNLLLWAIVCYSWLLALSQPQPTAVWQVPVIISCFFVVMALVATHRLDRIQWRWLTVAGAMTYPLYLIHQDIGYTAIDYLRNLIPAPLLVALTYLAMLGLAWLIHRLVERPFGPLLRRALASAVDTVRRSDQPAPGAGGQAAGAGTRQKSAEAGAYPPAAEAGARPRSAETETGPGHELARLFGPIK
jgi:peptidoglycan/LPS O-acetylase OafA/YrhL